MILTFIASRPSSNAIRSRLKSAREIIMERPSAAATATSERSRLGLRVTAKCGRLNRTYSATFETKASHSLGSHDGSSPDIQSPPVVVDGAVRIPAHPPSGKYTEHQAVLLEGLGLNPNLGLPRCCQLLPLQPRIILAERLERLLRIVRLRSERTSMPAAPRYCI